MPDSPLSPEVKVNLAGLDDPSQPFFSPRDAPVSEPFKEWSESRRRYMMSLWLIIPAWFLTAACLIGSYTFATADKTIASQVILLATNVISAVGGFWIGGALAKGEGK